MTTIKSCQEIILSLPWCRYRSWSFTIRLHDLIERMSPPLRVIHIVCEARAFERAESVARRSVASIYGTMQDKKWERGTKDFLDVFLFRFSRESRRQWYRITESETKVFGRCNMHFFKNKTLSRCLFEIFYVYLIKIISTRVCTFLSLIILVIYI